MAFVESPRFPDKISYGSSGGPKFNTDVIKIESGYESRNINWSQARHMYDAAFGVADEDRLSELINFFKAMRGMAHSFRYKDWADYKSCDLTATPARTDQTIGTADGIETDFQITKTYTAGLTYTRTIDKPVNGTLLVEVNGVLQTEGALNDYEVDYTTGIISFNSAPSTGDIKCGYEFDVPCRFDTDELSITIDAYAVGSTTVPIIEVKI